MDSDNQLVIFCEDDEYRVCHVCDEFYIERFYKNHLKSQTHINNIRNREQINKSFNN